MADEQTPTNKKRGRPRKKPEPKPEPKPPLAPTVRLYAWAWLTGRGREGVDAVSQSTAEPGANDRAPAIQGGVSEVVRTHLKGVLEALIFASDRPLPAKELARLAKAERALVKELLAELSAEYHARGFRLDEVAGGFAFRTSPAFAPFVREMAEKKPIRMSRAQIETLAIVAYRQPITRPEVDDVRGVDSGAVLKSLLERDLVRILGKKEEPGRPMLYGTTPQFLEFFGLKSLGDLPTLREFTELSDESRRAYERELGEEVPEEVERAVTGQGDSGLAGGEGSFQSPPVGEHHHAESVGASEDEGAFEAGEVNGEESLSDRESSAQPKAREEEEDESRSEEETVSEHEQKRAEEVEDRLEEEEEEEDEEDEEDEDEEDDEEDDEDEDEDEEDDEDDEDDEDEDEEDDEDDEDEEDDEDDEDEEDDEDDEDEDDDDEDEEEVVK
jgi:segregation and condensation protein B